MVEQLRKYPIPTINITVSILIFAVNLFDQISKGQSLIGRVHFTLPFLIFAILCFIFRKKYIFNAYLFATIAIIAILMTQDSGNITGIIMLIFSLYIFQSIKTNIILLGLIILSIASKIFMGFTAMQVLILYMGSAYCLIIYYILIHPKPKKITEISDIPDDMKQIFNFMMKGKNNKEIAAALIQYDYSQDVIRKKIKIFIDKLGLSGVPELFVYLNEKGHIEKN